MRILINGGTRGIGKDTAIELSRDKDNVIIVTGRNKALLEKLGSSHPSIHVFSFDITSDEKEFAQLYEFIRSRTGELDLMINCSGYLKSKAFIDADPADVKKMMETNFFGPAKMIKAMRPIMAKNSHIVNITSMGGFQGSAKFPGMSYYSASKAALACLSECLAVEFAEYKISVNALAIGAVQTEMLEEAFPGYQAPVKAKEMAQFIADFGLKGHKFFNGKVLPVAVSTP
jgi:NAD(P)-dependent dehydrogenase (short-subunit alcohol dehydrogenase family)